MSADNQMLPPMDPKVPYETVREQLATGDLIFLQTASRQGLWIEWIEERAGLPPFSHVGMVIKHGDELYLWDAPGGGQCFPDPYVDDPENRIHGSPAAHSGCRVSRLDEVIPYYRTRTRDGVHGFWVRQMKPASSQEQFTALRRFIDRVDGLPFPIGLGYTALARNFVDGQSGTTRFFGTYFCSQLVADSYMHMGLLEMDARPPNAYAPAHFGMETTDFGPKSPPAWVPGMGLDRAIFVSWPRETETSDSAQTGSV